MFKLAPRQNLALASRDAILAASRCPACHPRLNPIDATARVRFHSTAGASFTPGRRAELERARQDTLARTEFYASGPGGVDLSFEEYKRRRDATRPPDVPLDGLIPKTLPSLLQVFQYMSSNANAPSKNAYYSLMEAAAEYSRVRNGEDVPELRGKLASVSQDEVTPQRLTAALSGRADPTPSGAPTHERTGLGWKIAWSAWQDARNGGLDLGARGFELLLEAARPHPHLVPSLLYHAQNNPAIYQAITGTTYDFLLRAALAGNRFESVLALMTEMRMRGMTPAQGLMTRVVETCCAHGAARVALELSEAYERAAGKKVEPGAWAEILRASADCHFMAGIESAWDRLVEHGTFKPDEGLCILILNAAARHGNPGLATAVLAQFTQLGIQGREYHYAPVLEAFCATGSLPEALQILDTMRTHGGVEPTLATARPLVESMVSRGDIKWVDAGFDALEALHIKGQRVDPAAFNAVLKAAAEYGDLKRAVVIFRQAESFEVTPNLETFNTLLAACVKAGAAEQAEIVKKDMESQLGAATKDADTYQHLIELYLEQENYEPAFQYLEEMKAARFRPPLSVYEGMVRRCWKASDERFRLVLEEMQLGGYKPSRGLVDFLGNRASEANRGEQGKPRERRAAGAPRRERPAGAAGPSKR